MEWDGISMDEVGHFWLVDDDNGEPYSGPYDTLEAAQEALDDLTQKQVALLDTYGAAMEAPKK